VSPLLANVYLHYVFDLWADWWRRRCARGDVIIVRFADDFIVGFEYQEDAQRFLAELRERFAKFALELHPDKTRLIEFGRFAAARRRARGLGKPETFDFLGFTHICASMRDGRFWVRRITISKRLRAKLREVNDQRGLPHPGDAALASGARAPQSAHADQLEPDGPPCHSMAAARPCGASLPRCAFSRSDPRQEPSALVAHAGICAGGRSQGRSLPR
jgi:hypothetical protein